MVSFESGYQLFIASGDYLNISQVLVETLRLMK